MKKKVVAIIQARMGSKRQPGKSLAPLAGHPLLWQFLRRVKRATLLDEIVLATTMGKEDDVLENIAIECMVGVFRGSENDLVDRYFQAAKIHKADVVVRICADNPVVEPAEIDRIVAYHLHGKSDFSSNTQNILDNQYPNGLGAEVFDIDKLEYVWKNASLPRHREHVHTYFNEHPELFKIGTISCPKEFARPNLILDVNTEKDLRFLQNIYEYCWPRNPQFHIIDILAWYDNVYKPSLPQS